LDGELAQPARYRPDVLLELGVADGASLEPDRCFRRCPAAPACDPFSGVRDHVAAIATRIGHRSAAINEVMAAAAGADPEIAALYERQHQDRYRDERRLARSLARKHALRLGLSETQAADTIWAIATTRTYRALVHQRGWTTDHYERWLAKVLINALLAGRSTPSG
jgi:hypothetical protein